jgi:hypothetical protein
MVLPTSKASCLHSSRCLPSGDAIRRFIGVPNCPLAGMIPARLWKLESPLHPFRSPVQPYQRLNLRTSHPEMRLTVDGPSHALTLLLPILLLRRSFVCKERWRNSPARSQSECIANGGMPRRMRGRRVHCAVPPPPCRRTRSVIPLFIKYPRLRYSLKYHTVEI